MFISEFLGRTILYFEQIVMELFSHLLLKKLVLDYFQDLQKLKTNHKFVKNLSLVYFPILLLKKFQIS